MKHVACILAVLSLCPAALADERDHDRAWQAVRDGHILPLKDILARAERDAPGQMLEAELEDKRGELVYEIKMLGAEGRVTKLYYDARSGALLRTKGPRP